MHSAQETRQQWGWGLEATGSGVGGQNLKKSGVGNCRERSL